MKYNGGSWVNVGSLGFSDSAVDYITIAIDSSGTPYVAYKDYYKSQKATVMQYNGSSWAPLGSPGFSAGAAFYTSIAINRNGAPYVVYSDNGNGARTTVMEYNGSSWANVGSPGFSPGGAIMTSMAINDSGVPYIVYADFGHARANVMSFGTGVVDTSNGVKNIITSAPSLNIFPIPNCGSFNLNISSAQNENAAVTITNMLGEKVKEITVRTNEDNEVVLDGAAGMYFVTAVTSEGKITRKIAVE